MPKLAFFYGLVISLLVMTLAASQILSLIELGRIAPDRVAQDQAEIFPSSILRKCIFTHFDHRLETALVRLDNQNSERDYGAWENSVEAADNAALNALSCMPTNGYYWARFAMLRQAQVENATELRSIVELSQKYAPIELNAMSVRLALINRLSEPTFTALVTLLQKDREIICSDRYLWVQRQLPSPNAETLRRFNISTRGSWC